MLRFVGEFDGSRMDYGEDDAQAVENIAQQLHDPVQREEIRRLLQSFLDHADPEEEIAVDITLCMEQIAELPPALTPEQAPDRRNRRLSGGGRICGFQRTGRRRLDGLPCSWRQR